MTTRARWRFRLPHWEVHDRPHFITIRCAGSLPAEAVSRLLEIRQTLEAIPSHSPQFATLQRQYFREAERYGDAGFGECPFRNGLVCRFATASLERFPEQNGWRATDYTFMPNHVHLLIAPGSGSSDLKTAIRGWKWYVAREANRSLGRTGAFWQSDWFDRWSRNDAETTRMRDYIRNNPVKAGLVRRWQEHPWTHSETQAQGSRS